MLLHALPGDVHFKYSFTGNDEEKTETLRLSKKYIRQRQLYGAQKYGVFSNYITKYAAR